MDRLTEVQAYGAGRAGSNFDIIVFVKKPQVLLRIVAWIFGVIVFGCIGQEGYIDGVCRYNGSNACAYATTVGVIAFLLTMLFTAVDIYFTNISSIKVRRRIVLGELATSSIMIFFWFIGFCYMSDQWRQEPEKNKDGWNGRNSVQTAIVFSFFSILIWTGLTFSTFHRYREGLSNYENHLIRDDAATYDEYLPAGID